MMEPFLKSQAVKVHVIGLNYKTSGFLKENGRYMRVFTHLG